MNVRELMEELGKFDPEMTVYMSEHTGNYWGHVLAKPVGGIGVELAEYSDYNRALRIIDRYSDNERGADNAQEVLTIGIY